MTDPVVSIYGHNYERDTIVDWLASGNTTCPMTDKLLTSNDIVSNTPLRFRIQMWRQQQQQQHECVPQAQGDIDEDDDEDEEERYLKKFGLFVAASETKGNNITKNSNDNDDDDDDGSELSGPFSNTSKKQPRVVSRLPRRALAQIMTLFRLKRTPVIDVQGMEMVKATTGSAATSLVLLEEEEEDVSSNSKNYTY
jgi:U-box domain